MEFPYPGVLIPADGKALPKELSPLPQLVLPKELFRHRGANPEYIQGEIVRAVQNRQCRVSKVGSFKDAFELKPRIKQVDWQNFWSFLEEVWCADPDFFPPNTTMADVANSLNTTVFCLRERVFKDKENFCSMVRSLAQEHYRKFLERARVGCFVKKYSDAHMWDYYSQGGAGVLLGYERDLEYVRHYLGDGGPSVVLDPGPDPSEQPDKIRVEFGRGFTTSKQALSSLMLRYQYRSHCVFGNVRYTKRTESVSDLDIFKSAVSVKEPFLYHWIKYQISRDFMQKMVFTKAFTYRDEREWRLLYKKDDDWADFSAYRLRSVTIGNVASEELSELVQSLCRNYSLDCFKAVRPSNRMEFDRSRVV